MTTGSSFAALTGDGERETIRRALEMSPVKRQAARLMGISPRAMSHYLAKHALIDRMRRPRCRTGPTLPLVFRPSSRSLVKGRALGGGWRWRFRLG